MPSPVADNSGWDIPSPAGTTASIGQQMDQAQVDFVRNVFAFVIRILEIRL